MTCSRGFQAILMIVGLFGSVSGAQSTVTVEGSSHTKVGEVLRDKKFEEDRRITDLELKAQAGSLSRYSVKANLGYSGPPITNLSDPLRPEPPDGRRSGDPRTNLMGSLGLRYRLSSEDALNFGTGLTWFAPYQAIIGEKVERRPGAKNYDFNDPYAGYDRSYAYGPVQFRTGTKYAHTTTDYYQSMGQWGRFSFDQGMKFTPGHSRWILGLALSADYFAFNRSFDEARDGSNLSKYHLMALPSVEYKISSKLNANTSVSYSYQNLRSDHSWLRWRHPPSGWRLGLGWALRRDVYLNPYLSFYADKPAFNTASLSLNTIFSLF